ncbi:MAG: hypothetical protein ACYS8W_07745, partial [Planctomycetota bacterium]
MLTKKLFSGSGGWGKLSRNLRDIIVPDEAWRVRALVLVLAILVGSIASGCGAGATIAAMSDDDDDDIPFNGAPVVLILPIGDSQGCVSVLYELYDSEGNTVTIYPEYATVTVDPVTGQEQNRSAFSPATPHSSTPTVIASPPQGPGGNKFTIVWDSKVDIPSEDTWVIFALVPFDGTDNGSRAESIPFRLRNNTLPVIESLNPPATTRGQISLNYVIRDDDGTSGPVPALIIPQYRIGAGAWQNATDAGAGAGSDGTSLTATKTGEGHVFVWDSVIDTFEENMLDVTFRIIPVDGASGLYDVANAKETGPFMVRNNTPPWAEITTPAGEQSGDTLFINYRLYDSRLHLADIVFKYSTDGVNFFNGTETMGGDGTTGLTTLVGGDSHTFAWAMKLDLGETREETVYVRIIPSDQDIGNAADSGSFIVENTPVAQNTPPQASIDTPIGISSGDIVISYRLYDAEQDNANITVEFSTDGGNNYIIATPAVAHGQHEGDNNLLTSNVTGVQHYWVWDSIADFPSNYSETVRMRIIPGDAFGNGIGIPTGNFKVNNNTQPYLNISFPLLGNIVSGNAVITYNLFDQNSDNCSLLVEYSIDGGSNYEIATEMPGPPSNGSTDLPSSPVGVAHSWVWDTATDIGPTRVDNVIVRLTPSDAFAGIPSESEVFTVDNNTPPSVVVDQISGTKAFNIPISYTLFDDGLDNASIVVEYSVDSGPWMLTTPDATNTFHDGDANLTTSPAGVPHLYYWNSLVDLGAVNASNVVVRITPSDSGTGNPDNTGAFNVNNESAANLPPTTVIATPASGLNGNIPIVYQLLDSEGDLANVSISYSLDGVDFSNSATEAIDPYSDGKINLDTSVTGVTHVFVWDSQGDLGSINVSQVRIRIIASDAFAGAGSPFTTGVFSVRNNAPPAVSIIPPGPIEIGNVTINYDLFDNESNAVDINVRYSVDGGQSYSPATEAPDPPSQGTTGLSATPGGDLHVFVWDSLADVGEANVTARLRIIGSDGTAGSPATTANFNVQNNTPPVVSVGTPPSPSSSDVQVNYVLYDSNSDLASVVIEFSNNSGADWYTATMGPGSDPVASLPASPGGVPYRFVWASAQDLANTNVPGVLIRITPSDADAGSPVQSGPFNVENDQVPVVINVMSAASPASGDAIINYMLSDPNSDLCDIVVTYSIDGGSNWLNATQGAGGDPITSLSSTPAGVSHSFSWNTIADLGYSYLASVMVRITPYDSRGGVADTSLSFVVDNNQPPQVTPLNVTSPTSGNIFAYYRVADSASDPVDMYIEYTVNGGASWRSATEASGSEGKTGLTTSSVGTLHLFVWDSMIEPDVGAGFNGNAQFRFVAWDGFENSAVAQSNSFAVINTVGNTPPSAAVVYPAANSHVRGNITVVYTLSDVESNPCDIIIEFSTNGGGSWTNCTEIVGDPSEGKAGLNSTPGGGMTHVYVWDAPGDLGSVSLYDVRVRVTPSDAFAGTGATGESGSFVFDPEPPVPLSATQSISLDPTGRTIVIVFDNGITAASAENIANYIIPGFSVTSAALQADNKTVQITLDAAPVPGVDMLTIINIFDLAGNRTPQPVQLPIGSTDVTAPNATTVVAEAVSGRWNDRINVTFDEDVRQDDAINPANYDLESPTGTAVSLAGATLTYDSPTRTVTITFDDSTQPPVDLKFGASFSIDVLNVRDLAGNTMNPYSTTGIVTGDNIAPGVLTVLQNLGANPFGSTYDITFDEQLDNLSAADTTRYAATGATTSAAVLLGDGVTVRVVFSSTVVPGIHSITVSGVKDLAGNPCSLLTPAMTSTDATAPTINSASAITVSGYLNDYIVVVFDGPVHVSDAENLANYSFESPIGTPVDIFGSTITYDAWTYTTRITLDAVSPNDDNLDTDETFQVVLNNIRDIAGNMIAAGANISGIVTGDGTAPTLLSAKLNLEVDPWGKTLDLTFDEPLDTTSAESVTNYLVGGSGVTGAVLLTGGGADRRIVRLTFASPAEPGVTTLDVSNVADVAKNVIVAVAAYAITSDSPDAPTSFAVQATASGSITWEWTSGGGVTEFKLYDADTDSEVSSVGSAAVQLTETGLEQNNSYRRYIRGYNGALPSLPSNTAFGWTNAAEPDNDDFTVSAGVVSVNMSYPALPRGTVDQTGALFVFGNATDFIDNSGWTNTYTATHPGLASNTTYRYYLKLRNAVGFETGCSDIVVVHTLCKAPDSIILTGGSDIALDIQWDVMGNPGWTTFEVQRSTDGSNWVSTHLTAADNVSHTGLVPDTAHFFRVRAINMDGFASGWSASVVYTTAPPQPTGFTSLDLTNVSITWGWVDESVSENRFIIIDENGSPVLYTPSDSTNASETGLAPNTSYYRRVVAESSDGVYSRASNSQMVFTACTAPVDSDFTVTSGYNNLSLTIAPPDNPSVGMTGAYFELVSGVGGYDCGWTSGLYSVEINGLVPNATYYYRVRLRNASGYITPWTQAKSVYTGLDTPAGLVAENATISTIDIAWSAANPAYTTYELFRSSPDNTAYAFLWSGQGTAYSDTGLAPGMTYYYTVRAVGLGGSYSGNATEAFAVTSGLLAPTGLTIAFRNEDTITWQWVDNAVTEDGYRLYDDNGSLIQTLGADVTQDTETLAPNTRVARYVVAYEGVSESDPTNTVETYTLLPPPGDVDLTLTVHEMWMNLAGTAPANLGDGLTGLKFYHTNAAPGGTSSPWLDETGYIDSGLTPNTTYEYVLRYRNGSGDVTDSNPTPKYEVTLANRPGNISFPVVNALGLEIQIAWLDNSNPGWTTYELEFSSPDNSSFVNLTTNTSLTFTHNIPDASTTYYYRARAMNIDGIYSAYTPEAIVNPAGQMYSGIIYTDYTETTALTGVALNVSICVNGNAMNTEPINTLTGEFSVSAQGNSGDIVIIYIDDDVTYKGSVVTRSNGGSMGGINIYRDRLTVRNDRNPVIPITHQLMWQGGYEMTGSQADSDILYTVNNSSWLLMTSLNIGLTVKDIYNATGNFGWSLSKAGGLHVLAGGTFNLQNSRGADVENEVRIDGTLQIEQSGSSFFAYGNWSDYGSFIHGNSSTFMRGGGGQYGFTTNPFYNLTVQGAGTAFTMLSDLNVTRNLAVTTSANLTTDNHALTAEFITISGDGVVDASQATSVETISPSILSFRMNYGRFFAPTNSAATVTIGGDLYFDPGSSVAVFNGESALISIAGDISWSNTAINKQINFDNASVTVAGNFMFFGDISHDQADVTLNGSLYANGGSFAAGSSVYTFAGCSCVIDGDIDLVLNEAIISSNYFQGIDNLSAERIDIPPAGLLSSSGDAHILRITGPDGTGGLIINNGSFIFQGEQTILLGDTTPISITNGALFVSEGEYLTSGQCGLGTTPTVATDPGAFGNRSYVGLWVRFDSGGGGGGPDEYSRIIANDCNSVTFTPAQSESIMGNWYQIFTPVSIESEDSSGTANGYISA